MLGNDVPVVTTVCATNLYGSRLFRCEPLFVALRCSCARFPVFNCGDCQRGKGRHRLVGADYCVAAHSLWTVLCRMVTTRRLRV